MPNTSSQAGDHRLRDQVERLVGQRDASIPQGFTQAMQSLLAAVDYDDPALMRSHLNAALEALQQVVQDAVQRRLGWPQHVRERCRTIRELMKGCPGENWDEVGKELEARFDEAVQILIELRDGSVKKLEEHGYRIGNAAQLEIAIQELEDLKQGMLSDWPWSQLELPPVNREMVAESRAAIRRGEGEPIEDLIHRLGGNTARKG